MLRLKMFPKILAVQEPVGAVAAVDFVRDLLLQLRVHFVSFAVPVSLDCLFTEELLFTGVAVKLQLTIRVNQKAVCFH